MKCNQIVNLAKKKSISSLKKGLARVRDWHIYKVLGRMTYGANLVLCCG